jgi:hypothetical protein
MTDKIECHVFRNGTRILEQGIFVVGDADCDHIRIGTLCHSIHDRLLEMNGIPRKLYKIVDVESP